MRKHITTLAETVLIERGPKLHDFLTNLVLDRIANCSEDNVELLDNIAEALANPVEFNLIVDGCNNEETMESLASAIAVVWSNDLPADFESIDVTSQSVNTYIKLFFDEFK